MPVETTSNPTSEEIGELIAYLPILYAKGFAPIQKWNGGKQENGTITSPWPNYNESVARFFRTASQEQWCDYGYDPCKASDMLDNDKFVQKASISEIKTMLTYCVRGEHFCDGFWAEIIENGNIRKILKRLIQLQSEKM